MSSKTSVGQRLNFLNASAAIKRAGMNPGKAVLSSSYLRLETLINATSSPTNLRFDVLVNENTQQATFPTQQKLNLQDAFVCSSIGLYLGCPATTTDSTFRLLSYPSVGNILGTAGNFQAAQAAAAQVIYNGYLSLTINQRTILPYWDLARHLDIPQTQAAAVVASNTAAPATPNFWHFTDDFFDGGDSAQYPCEPNIIFSGAKKHDLTVTLPSGIPTTSLPANGIRVVLLLRGILAQNVTSVN
jgi:hypothetical protein